MMTMLDGRRFLQKPGGVAMSGSVSGLIPPTTSARATTTSAAIGISALVTLIGIPPSTVVAHESGIKDPGFVVIDEVAGQMIALIAVPVNWKYMLAGFILFRSFDIVKPFPLRRLEALPGGTGIMMDDVGAGLYALALLHIWLHFIAH